jgi:hypothetical protein
MHSVVSDTIGGTASSKPRLAWLPTPQVVELKPGVYHAGGLLPLDHVKGWFGVWSVYTASKWCVQRLTGSELTSAFDVPHQVVSQCSSAEHAVTLHPGRGLEHGAWALLAHAGVIDQGGEYVFLFGSDPASTVVMTVDSDPGLTIERLVEGEAGEEEQGTRLGSQLGTESRQVVGDKKEEGEAPDLKASKMDYVPASEEGKDRDLKAVKADDAPIPVWLWNDAIIQGLEQPPSCCGHSAACVDKALEVL